MPLIAQGCVGAISCEAGQTRQGTSVACDVGNGDCRPAAQKIELRPGAVHLDPAKRYFISVLPGDGVNPTIGGAGGAVQVDASCDPTATNCPLRQFDISKECGPYDPADPRWQPGNLGTDADPTTALCGHAMGGASDRRRPGCGRHQAAGDSAADGQDRRLRLRGRLSAERRGGRRRRRWHHARAERAWTGRVRDQDLRPGGCSRRCDRTDHLRHVQPARVQFAGRDHRSGHRSGCVSDHDEERRTGGDGPDLPEVRVRRLDDVAARGSGGHRQPLSRLVRDRGHARSRPHRARRGVAADQHAGRHQAARGVHQAQRAGLLPGVRPGRLPRLHRLRQPADHQQSAEQCGRHRHLRFYGDRRRRSRLQRHDQRAGLEHAHEPHARPAHLQQRRLRRLQLHPVLPLPRPSGRGGLRLRQVRCRTDWPALRAFPWATGR